ncbi:MAG TPA: protein kinase [Kofleriaceae bacterium]|nr:protein kinase [Kofleriaceae bacterium]
MGGQAAEQIIAGVVLSERLAVTMYGAIHRAQWAGQRNLRGLVVDPKLLNEPVFRYALTDARSIEQALALDHAAIVPTVAVETNGPDVVIVTRGVGRYVTVQDLIAAARANRREGGKLSPPVAGAIARAVVEALAVAHRAGVVHGAVHPRSVLVDEDGAIRLGDFVVGRALTTAVAQGADSSMWRGLAGFLAPELVVGEDPTTAADVFAVGAMLFTMLSGEVPPGTLHVTPAVERLVQRALDTDRVRRYRTASDLLENMLEAFEDDRWTIADRGEIIRAAGLGRSDTNIDDATEDLLASLGNSAVQVTPMRPSMDIRAEAIVARHTSRKSSPGTPTGNRLDALLADLDSNVEHTAVDFHGVGPDPISELIQMDPRQREAIVQRGRVPSLDDPDDHDPTPLPPPQRDSDSDVRARGPRSESRDEAAALDAIANLDEPGRRIHSAAEVAELAAQKLEVAARRAEQAANRVATSAELPKPITRPRPAVAPIVDPIPQLELPPPRLKSRLRGVLVVLVLAAISVGAAFLILKNQEDAAEARRQSEARHAEAQRKADELSKQMTAELADPGTIAVKSTPPGGGVWLKLGRTPLDSLPLSSGMMHELRVEGVDGVQPIDTQVLPSHWSGDGDKRAAKLVVGLKPMTKDPKTGKLVAQKLPAMPPKPPAATGYQPGRGPIHIETTPPGAEVWLFVGMTDQVQIQGIQAGVAYELRVLKDGFLPAYLSVAPDEWREPGGDPKTPINVAKKKLVLEKSVELQPDPAADKKKGS